MLPGTIGNFWSKDVTAFICLLINLINIYSVPTLSMAWVCQAQSYNGKQGRLYRKYIESGKNGFWKTVLEIVEVVLKEMMIKT